MSESSDSGDDVDVDGIIELDKETRSEDIETTDSDETGVDRPDPDDGDDDNDDDVEIDMGELDVNDQFIEDKDEYDEKSLDNEDLEDEEFEASERAKYDTDNPPEVVEHVLMTQHDDEDIPPSIRSDLFVALQEIDADILDEYRDRVEALIGEDVVAALRAVSRDESVDNITPGEVMGNEINSRIVHSDTSVSRIVEGEVDALEEEIVLNFGFDMKKKLVLPDASETGVFEIRPDDGTVVEKEADPTVLQDVQDFRDEITGSFYRTVFEIPRSHQATVLREMSKEIGRGAPVIQGVHQQGFHDGKFVTAGGVIDSDGWVDDPEHRFVAYHDDTEVSNSFEAEPDGDSIDDDEVREIMELLVNIRKQERLTPILSWFWATPHADTIREKVDMFNHLNVTGEAGSGKTQTIRTLMKLLGFDLDPFQIDDSAYVLDNKLMSVKDMPVWFDEYMPVDYEEKELNRFHSKYKFAATGGTSTRGNWGGDDTAWELGAPIVTTGEHEMDGNAESRRTINVRVSDESRRIDKHSTAFKTLTGKITGEESGVDSTDFNLIGFAEEFYAFAARQEDPVERLEKCKHEVNSLIESWDVELGDDEVRGLAIIMMGWELLCEFAEEFDVDGDVLPSRDVLVDSLHHVAGVDEDGHGHGRVTEEDEFFSLMARAVASDELEFNKDYTTVRRDKASCELRIKTERCYDVISKYARDHNLDVGLLSSGTEYKKRFKQLAEEDDSYISCYGKRSTPINRCVGVRVRDLIDEVEGVSVHAFDGIEYDFAGDDDEEDEEDSDVPEFEDSNGVAIRPIEDISVADEHEELSVTVEVLSWSNDSNLPLKGKVRDETGMIDVVSFEQELAHVEEGDCIVISAASVGEYSGSPQLRVEGHTVVGDIQRGRGYCPAESSDAQQVGVQETGEEA